MGNLAALILRVVLGGLLAGHGAQKLFGSFGGPGIEGTSGFMEMLGLRPGKQWAMLAGLSEFGGGLLTVLGFLNPLGPIGVIGSMAMATTKAHWGKPIWVTEGGAELPVTNIAAATALIVGGPGKYSLDNAFGVRLPSWLAPLGLVAVILTVIYAGVGTPEPPEQDEAREGTAGNDEA
jgi:putative oxidoreductase